MSYTNWDDNEPGNDWDTHIEDCVVLYEKERKWHDTKCFYWYRYICKKIQPIQGFLYELIVPELEPKIQEPTPPQEEKPEPEEEDLGEKQLEDEKDQYEAELKRIKLDGEIDKT